MLLNILLYVGQPHDNRGDQTQTLTVPRWRYPALEEYRCSGREDRLVGTTRPSRESVSHLPSLSVWLPPGPTQGNRKVKQPAQGHTVCSHWAQTKACRSNPEDSSCVTTVLPCMFVLFAFNFKSTWVAQCFSNCSMHQIHRRPLQTAMAGPQHVFLV